MKTFISLFNLLVLLFAFTGLQACNNDSYDGDVRLESCKTGTKKLNDFPTTEVLLFRGSVPEDIDKEQVYILFDGMDAGLSTKNKPVDLKYEYTICNFPEEVRGWEIPSSGFPVLIRGKVYDYSGDGHHPAIFMGFYLELTYIKRR